MATQRKQRDPQDERVTSATQVAIETLREQGIRPLAKRAANDASEDVALQESQAGTQPDLKALSRDHQDVPLFDRSIEDVHGASSDLHGLNGEETGYLVIFTEDNTVQAMLYDKSLQFIGDVDLNSEEAAQMLEKSEEVTNLDDSIWDTIMGDLGPEQRMESKVFRLSGEIINERDAEIEEVMLDNDDERPYGYNDDEDDYDFRELKPDQD